jgi:hypothetical protein
MADLIEEITKQIAPIQTSARARIITQIKSAR